MLLDAGKGREGGDQATGFAALKKQTSSSIRPINPTAEEVEGAAKKLHAWLSKVCVCMSHGVIGSMRIDSQESSPLRGILSILSGDGAFYAGHVAEKTARAWVQCKPATAQDVVTAAQARQRQAQAPAPGPRTDDAVGLLD